MPLRHVLLLGFIFIAVLSGPINGGLSDQLLEIFKRLIQTECNCTPYYCCSKWGYCGLTKAYCGDGCQSGPCISKPTKSPERFDITSEIFDCVFPDLNINIRTRRFQGLTKAMEQMKWAPVNAVEGAIFLAHIAYETDGLQTLAEDCIKHDTCDKYQSSWCSIQANPNRKYYSRGMLPLSYPCHYYEAGKALGLDLLNNPDLVSQSDRIAAATAIWYYRETEMNEFAQQGDFGGSTRPLNKYKCSSNIGHSIHTTRVKIYHKVRQCFGLPETTMNLTC